MADMVSPGHREIGTPMGRVIVPAIGVAVKGFSPQTERQTQER
jgi:hypothetical protein